MDWSSIEALKPLGTLNALVDSAVLSAVGAGTGMEACLSGTKDSVCCVIVGSCFEGLTCCVEAGPAPAIARAGRTGEGDLLLGSDVLRSSVSCERCGESKWRAGIAEAGRADVEGLDGF